MTTTWFAGSAAAPRRSYRPRPGAAVGRAAVEEAHELGLAELLLVGLVRRAQVVARPSRCVSTISSSASSLSWWRSSARARSTCGPLSRAATMVRPTLAAASAAAAALCAAGVDADALAFWTLAAARGAASSGSESKSESNEVAGSASLGPVDVRSDAVQQAACPRSCLRGLPRFPQARGARGTSKNTTYKPRPTHNPSTRARI